MLFLMKIYEWVLKAGAFTNSPDGLKLIYLNLNSIKLKQPW